MSEPVGDGRGPDAIETDATQAASRRRTYLVIALAVLAGILLGGSALLFLSGDGGDSEASAPIAHGTPSPSPSPSATTTPRTSHAVISHRDPFRPLVSTPTAPSPTATETSTPAPKPSKTKSDTDATTTSTKSTGGQQSATVRFANCATLNAVYPSGVGKTTATDKVESGATPVTNFERNDALYKKNKSLDRDGDKIACEAETAGTGAASDAGATTAGSTGTPNPATTDVTTPAQPAPETASAGATPALAPTATEANPTAPQPTATGKTPASGNTLVVKSIAKDLSSARVAVNATEYTVEPGETFADYYQMYDVFNSNCAGFLFGDANAVACIGEPVAL